jgi:hypothetical protein
MDDIMCSDRQLAQEIEFDLRHFEQTQNQGDAVFKAPFPVIKPVGAVTPKATPKAPTPSFSVPKVKPYFLYCGCDDGRTSSTKKVTFKNDENASGQMMTPAPKPARTSLSGSDTQKRAWNIQSPVRFICVSGVDIRLCVVRVPCVQPNVTMTTWTRMPKFQGTRIKRIVTAIYFLVAWE